MNDEEILEQLKAINIKLDKIETFLAHDGLSEMLNEKLSYNFGEMTKALVAKMDKIEQAIRKDQK
jgi:DNA-binding FrmR family transcriptional regulator